MGILHIVAFVTLCEHFMVIDPHFNLWNHFFCVRLPQGSNVEAMVCRGVIHVKFRHNVDPYFDIPKPESIAGSRKCGSF
jgi:hypothetical protein